MNGISAHATEMDDGSKFGLTHPGSPIISALIPLGCKLNLLLVMITFGIIIGYEIAIRVDWDAINRVIIKEVFTPSSTCGSIGVAAGAVQCLDFSIDEIESNSCCSNLFWWNP